MRNIPDEWGLPMGATREPAFEQASLFDREYGPEDGNRIPNGALRQEEPEDGDRVQTIIPVSATLPELICPENYIGNRPPLPEELIGGVLRQGHKMLVAGPSKAGKSFLLLELAVAIAEGIPWLGFPCKKGRVFYVNLEIDPASCVNRLLDIYDAMGIPAKHAGDIRILNLRGRAQTLDLLESDIVDAVKGENYSAVIIDPIYKVIMGDENNASDMGAFCNQFDRIADATGASVIYCHHHSKGAQGGKKAMDRASGSGVFARDPDAQLDITPLEMDPMMKNWLWDGKSTPWRLEGTLREFPSFEPIDFWFKYPLHERDTEEMLKNTFAEGSFEALREKSRRRSTPEERHKRLKNAYAACASHPPVTLNAMAEYLSRSPRSVRENLKEFPQEFRVKGGEVSLITTTD